MNILGSHVCPTGEEFLVCSLLPGEWVEVNDFQLGTNVTLGRAKELLDEAKRLGWFSSCLSTDRRTVTSKYYVVARETMNNLGEVCP